MTKVAILGGGVGGLSAAHELVERGFSVVVYEARDMWGGKARSVEKPDSATPGHKNLPGEHGFRFFPGFYKHLPDTMTRIPFPGNANGVFDNLVGSTQVGLFQQTALSIILPGRFPASMTEVEDAIYDLLHANFNIPTDEIDFFVEQLLVILTSCQERRLAEYEKIAWWNFINAANSSPEYQKLLGVGLTRSLVAMKAERASTRTVGDILLQLILYMFLPNVSDDRVLNAPTDDAWINPWIAYLTQRGVELHLEAPTLGLACNGQKITAARVSIAGTPVDVHADFFICAFPVEVMTRLLTPELTKASPALAALPKLSTEWMNGIQFYLARDVHVVNGHVIYLDSPWSLTSISQHQFWTGVNLGDYGAGNVQGILSVDISNWTAPGSETTKLPAEQCSAEQVALEVWAQLKAHLNKGTDILLDDKDLLGWNLDPDITFPRIDASNDENAEPLLVNEIDTWQYRPEAAIEISNLLLASDYVRTHTDLATMEGANEAARRAVNAILEKTRSAAPPCQIWPLHEPDVFAPLRDYDWLRFKMGLPHARDGWLTPLIGGGLYWAKAISGAIAAPVLWPARHIAPVMVGLIRAGRLFYKPGKPRKPTPPKPG